MRIVKHVSEPWFSQIAGSVKSVEGRLCKGDFAHLSEGDTIVWVNEDFGFKRTVRTTVKYVRTYPNFRKYLQTEGLDATLPAHGVTSINKGVKVYRQFFDQQMEKTYGVLAIGMIVAP